MREHPATLNEFKSPDPDELHLSSELTYGTDLLITGTLKNAKKTGRYPRQDNVQLSKREKVFLQTTVGNPDSDP